MNRVFVLDTLKRPLMPCSPARARRLLNAGKAAVYRMQPFTIILKYTVEPSPQPVEFKADPGSKTTGLALVGDFPRQGRVVLWACNLEHRGQAIRKRLADRLSLRRGRRGRKTRYREPRWRNRARHPLPGYEKWLAPSLRSRVDNVRVWYGRLLDRAPITSAAVETVRFDMQKLQNPEMNGVEYQQGTLYGYELREYLLEKWHRTCAYCGVKDVPLEIDHIHPRSLGGSDRVSNLTLACNKCNQRKNNQPVEVFVTDAERLRKLKAQAKAPLKDAAAINSIRWEIGHAIRSIGLPTSFWSGGRTKRNRVAQGYTKDHWLDAVCVGETGEAVTVPEGMRPLQIKATGRGGRQVVRTDKYGFPRSKAGRCKRVRGFQTGDLVKLTQPKGKYAGEHAGLLAGVRRTGMFDIKTAATKITASFKNYRLIQRGDGYAYSFAD